MSVDAIERASLDLRGKVLNDGRGISLPEAIVVKEVSAVGTDSIIADCWVCRHSFEYAIIPFTFDRDG